MSHFSGPPADVLAHLEATDLFEALDAARIGFWSLEIDSGKIAASENFDAVHGLPLGSVERTLESLLELIHPEDRDRVALAIERAVSDGTRYDIEYRTASGAPVQWIGARGHVAEDGAKPRRLITMTMNITARKVADEDRRVLAAIVSSSDDAIISKDLTGRILSWNDAAERMYGYSAEEVIGQHITILLPPGRPDDMSAILERIARGERVAHYETMRRRRDGAVLDVSLTVSPIHDDAGRVIGASKIARDITAIKRAERERERTRDLFLGILGHDLRNPLNTIQASLFTLQRNAPEPLRQVIPRISRSAERIARLIEQLLDFTRARLGEGIQLHLRRTDLAAICSGLVEELEIQHPGRIRFTGEGPLEGMWDADRIAQAFSNVIGNALQHGSPSEPVHVRLARETDVARFEVVNRGNPIPEEIRSAIFEPFRRGAGGGDRHPRGLGLGLFITHEIVRAHGGAIHVESDETGTRFSLDLPFRGADAT